MPIRQAGQPHPLHSAQLRLCAALQRTALLAQAQARAEGQRGGVPQDEAGVGDDAQRSDRRLRRRPAELERQPRVRVVDTADDASRQGPLHAVHGRGPPGRSACRPLGLSAAPQAVAYVRDAVLAAESGLRIPAGAAFGAHPR